MSDGSVVIEAKLTDEEIEKGINSIKTDLKSLEKASSSVSKNMANHFKNFGDKASKAGKTLTLGLTTPLTALGVAGVKYNAQMEDFEANLTTLLGNADDAKDMLADLKEMANTTPFETTDLLDATQTMLGFGLEAKKTKGYLQALGDISMGNAEKLKSLTRAFSQIGASGKATMEDINQMIDAGFNPLQIMSEKTGKSMAELREEVSDGEISFEDITEAMEDATKEGGRYYKSMEKASKTMNGKMSSALDALNTALGDLTESLLPLATKAIEKITDWANAFTELDEDSQEAILTIGGIVAGAGPIMGAVGKISSAIGGVSDTFRKIKSNIGDVKTELSKTSSSTEAFGGVLEGLTIPTGIAIGAIGAVSTALIYLSQDQTDAQEAAEELANKMLEQKESLDEYNQSVQDTLDANLTHVDSIKSLRDELETLVDENGKVKEGYESRVDFILNELNSALGTEYDLNGNVIDSYKELQNEIDTLIEKKRAEIFLSSYEEDYKNAIENQTEAVKNMKTAYEELSTYLEQYGTDLDGLKTKAEELRDLQEEWFAKPGTAAFLKSEEYRKEAEALENIISAYENAQYVVQDYTDKVERYTSNYELFVEEKYSEIGKTITDSTQAWSDASLETIQNSIIEQGKALDAYENIYRETGNTVAQELAEQSTENLQKLADELSSRTQTVEALGEQEIQAWKALAENSYEIYSEYVGKMAPEMQEKIQEATGVVIASTPEFAKQAGIMGEKVISEFDKNGQAKQEALKTLQGYYEGLNDKQKNALLKKTVGKKADEVAKQFENGDYETSGKNVLRGIYSGLSNGSLGQSLINKAAGIARSIANQFNIQWDEHSPSKLMEEKTEFLLKPISTVFSKREPKLINEAKNLAKGIIGGFDKSFMLNDIGNLYNKMKSTVDFETQRLSANLTSQQVINTEIEDNRQATLKSIDDNKEIVVNTTTKLDSKVLARETNKVNARRQLQYGY